MDSDWTRRARLAALPLLVAIGLAPWTLQAAAREPYATEAIRIEALPAEAREALDRIRTGSRLPYERDGVAFGNRERMLPAKPRGYYHEYTVKTPGARSRGARRIVCGGAIHSSTECYYSNDHYRSFKRIMQ